MNPRPVSAAALALLVFAALPGARAVEPINVGFLWHMHQPIYYPGETVTETDAAGHFSFNITDVHNQRLGPYRAWPRDAIQSGLSLPHLGAQVSFSGSLVQNLNVLEAAGVNGGQWNNWDADYKTAAGWDTSLGNPRLDLVNFGFNHPLMPLLDERDVRMQIKLQKRIHEQTWGPGVPFSKGIFPPETAFSTRIIPALVAEGIEWSIVDSIHLERATIGYPHTNGSNLFAPNRADQVNPGIESSGGQWVQLNNLWAPSRVGAPFAYRPHYAQHVDPATGAISQLVAVPAARYEGNEDGRGGFGALQYEQVMEQYRQLNTDPNHPMFVLLHHDGDNFGGGSDSYYHSNFQNMVDWAQANGNYDVTTIDDYLERFPVAAGDVVHVENGSWAGADNGDPEFKKWLGDPDGGGWSPDRNSWAVLTAAKNRVFTADDIAPATNLNNILAGTGTPTERAWRHLMTAESSDYWYWDGTEVWDSNVTRGSNLAVAQANQVLTPSALATEATPPTVFLPQREAYNPGGVEWNPAQPEPSDFEVWTFAYDVSGLESVTLKWRVDGDGTNPLDSTQNETYQGGPEVGAWNSAAMSSSDMVPPANILTPSYRALRYGAMITGQTEALVDYYVEAVDLLGNVERSDIQHVYVGPEITQPQGPAFTMDGQLDGVADEVASAGDRHLYAALAGDLLYLATEDAGEGDDVFIYLADEPGPLVAANWAKAGLVAEWDAYLADENDNDYESWFDAAGAPQAATGPNGGVLEGTLNLAQEFGQMPAAIYVAVGVYQSQDGGSLVASLQVPATANGDGNLDAVEFFLLQLVATPGDYNGDGNVDDADYRLWRDTFGSDEDLRADGNGDGVVDAADYTLWRDHAGAGGGASTATYVLKPLDFSTTHAVPEPESVLLAALAVAGIGAVRRIRGDYP